MTDLAAPTLTASTHVTPASRGGHTAVTRAAVDAITDDGERPTALELTLAEEAELDMLDPATVAALAALAAEEVPNDDDPWQRHSNETPHLFKLRTMYRDLSDWKSAKKRKVHDVADAVSPNPGYRDYLRRVAVAQDWSAEVAKWDDFCRAAFDRAQREADIALVENNTRIVANAATVIGATLNAAGLNLANHIKSGGTTRIDPSCGDLVRAMTVLHKEVVRPQLPSTPKRDHVSRTSAGPGLDRVGAPQFDEKSQTWVLPGGRALRDSPPSTGRARQLIESVNQLLGAMTDTEPDDSDLADDTDADDDLDDESESATDATEPTS